MAEKNTKIATTMRRLRGRERLLALARAARESTTENPELERLKCYLLDWAMSQRALDVARMNQGESTLGQYMKSDSPTMSELLNGSDAWALGIIATSIDDLLLLPKGSDMRSALFVRYLNEGISKELGHTIRIFRSGRLQAVSLMEVDALADAGELALIPIVKRHHLPL